MAECTDDDWTHRANELLPMALRLAVRMCGDPQLAEDSVQDALVKIAKYGGAFRGEAALASYLSRIVIHCCQDRMAAQKRSREQPLPVSVASGLESDPAFIQDQAERMAVIRRMVDQLPQRQREVLVLSVWDQRSPQEIAELLGLSVQAVYSNLSAAKQRLKGLLNASAVDPNSKSSH